MHDVRGQHQAVNGHTYTYSAIVVMHGENAAVQNLRVVDDTSGRPANIRLGEIAHATEASTPEEKAHHLIQQALDRIPA
jgi:hypothetical protein